MPGVAVKGRDSAGGEQGKIVKQEWFRLKSKGLVLSSSDPVITVGDKVHGHGDAPHAEPTMVEGESWFRLNGSPVCRAGHKASCGDTSTGRVWFRLESGNSGYRSYREVPSPECNVEHIPWIMRAKGWHEGAALMDRWFSRTATMDKALDPDTTTVKMDFILGAPNIPFLAARDRYDDLRDTSKWSMPNGSPARSPIQRLCNHLAADGHLTNAVHQFDYFRPSVPMMKGRQIDTRTVTQVVPGPLMGSVGTFEFFLMVSGVTEPDGANGHKVTITATGIFAEDDYNFEGPGLFGTVDFLGYWNTDLLALLPAPPGCLMDNQKFRDWRTKTGYGGDYLAYSDLKVEPLPVPYVFHCPVP